MKTIPQPRQHFIIGNLLDLDRTDTIQSLMRLAGEYGPIFRLQVFGTGMVIVSSQALVNELCDETRFDKRIHLPMGYLRENGGDALATAYTQEPNWGRAHRILQPGFGITALRSMFAPMWDIAEQLLLKWERLGEHARIDVATDTVRLALDTIALCAFDYRFNNFYGDVAHPFAAAVQRQFADANERMRRPPVMARLLIAAARQRTEDRRLMQDTAASVIARRRQRGERHDRSDLLDLMLSGKDPQTGEGLTDEFIGRQLTQFLIAGHETTSGLLTFAIYALLENKAVLAKAQAVVDRVLGNQLPRYEHLAELGYLDQVLKETLRLWPMAPAFALRPYAHETSLGDYTVREDDTILVLLPVLHRDPSVWSDPERFDPDRFAPDVFAKLPPNAWKPFGNGQRACIGQYFSMQEALLVLSTVLQRFDLSKADADYRLRIRETLTLKPQGFFIHARRRDVTITADRPAAETARTAMPQQAGAEEAVPLQVLFGSNGGSAQGFAQRIANDATSHGHDASLGTLDSAVGRLSPDRSVVIVAASYEGQPTDNARQFIAWIDRLPADALRGVRYTVFGCGNRDWVRTFQAVPTHIDQALQAAGATRILPRGQADARGDFFGDFDRWYAQLWPAIGIGAPIETAPHLVLEFVEPAHDPMLRLNHMQRGLVVENRELVRGAESFGRSRRHIEIALPDGCSYRPGDYLVVLPENPAGDVGRALRRFGLPYDAQVVLRPSPGLQTLFPIGTPVMAGELLRSYVELAMPATRRVVAQLAASAIDPADGEALAGLMATDAVYTSEVLEKRLSLLDLLERFGSCELSFAAFLHALPSLKPRQYSVSSSPRWSATHCTITVGVLNAPAWSGQGTHCGVASNYLALARPGTQIAVDTRPSHDGFHLPDDTATPIIMIAAGTGIAPFRGFLQDRAIRAAHGEALGVAHLFFGCHHCDVDFLYDDELRQWEQDSVVRVHPAFHKPTEGEALYVQDRLWADRAIVMRLMDEGARMYVCGDGHTMAAAVRTTLGRMYQELNGGTPAMVDAWLAELEKGFRYSQDVFT